MKLPFRIAWRYYFSRKQSGSWNAVSLISWISLLGYAVGACALVIILSVFNGFGALFATMYSNFDADIQLTPATGKVLRLSKSQIVALQSNPAIRSCAFVLEENALVKYNDKQGIATIKAVDEDYLKISGIDSNIIKGENILQTGDTGFAIVGLGIAYQLGIDPNDPFHLLGIYLPTKGEVDMLNPQSAFVHRTISPAGIFSVQEEVDNKYILISRKFAAEQLQTGDEITSLEMRLTDPRQSKSVQRALQEEIGSEILVKNRFEQRDSFYKVMQSEKSVSYLFLVFILLIAAFNTIGSLYMLVIEKQHDLLMLRSLGLTPQNAGLVFVFEGLLIALSGGFIGVLMGAGVCLGQQTFGWVSLQSVGSFVVSAYPVQLQTLDLIKVVLTLVVLGGVTSVYPAFRAARFMK